jgi:polar amino acid transport system permease protein
MKKVFSAVIAIAIYLAFFSYVNSRIPGELQLERYLPYGKVIFTGWLNTILISLVSILIALVVGLVLYLMQESKSQILYNIAEIHKLIIFGTPLLVIAIVSYYYIGFAFNINSKFLVGSLSLGLYIGAYIADIYKGAIESIHINQWQAAKMFGFTTFQTYRYIIFPQVLKSILPPIAGQLALTIKGSALLAYMATTELLNSLNTVMAATYLYREGFIIVTVGYWIITIPLILTVRKLQEKANYKNAINYSITN